MRIEMRSTKAVLLLSAVLLLAAVSARAEVATDTVTLDQFLGQLNAQEISLDSGSKKGDPFENKATCTANCFGAGTASCSTSGGCTAVDRNCSMGQRGYAQCGTTTKYCNACPPPCSCNPTTCDNQCGGPGMGACSCNVCNCK